MKDDASAEIVDRVGGSGSGSGSGGRGAIEGTRDSYETDHRAAGKADNHRCMNPVTS